MSRQAPHSDRMKPGVYNHENAAAYPQPADIYSPRTNSLPMQPSYTMNYPGYQQQPPYNADYGYDVKPAYEQMSNPNAYDMQLMEAHHGQGVPYHKRQPQKPPARFEADVPKVECLMQDFLFNRLQWYHVTLRFTDSNSKPTYVGEYIRFNDAITFIDGRRRNPTNQLNQNKQNALMINIMGTCGASAKLLRKCARCREKDKILTKRKRKRDEKTIWSDLDDRNNSKLIQVLSTGEGIVDEHGEIKFRIRIGCCVGVNKQHHLNHVDDDNDDQDACHIHKNCEGIVLKILIKRGEKTYECSPRDAIRVLGKVTETDRQKFQKKRKKRKLNNNARANAAPGASIPDTQVATNNNNPPRRHANYLSMILHNMVHKYRMVFDPMFPSPFKQIFDKDFFSHDSSLFDSYTQQSPQSLQIYTSLAIGASISGCIDICNSFWACAKNLADALIEVDWTTKREVLLLADGVNKVAMYFGTKAHSERANHYNSTAGQILEQFAADGAADVLNTAVYSSFIWGRLTFHRDLDTLQNGYKFAKYRQRNDIQAYSLFLMTMIYVCPSIQEELDPEHPPTLKPSKMGKEQALPVFRELKTILQSPAYRNAEQDGRSYGRLIDQGLAAMEAWLTGDDQMAAERAQKAAIQASLCKQPNFIALIPIYFAAWTNLQFIETQRELFELCLMAFWTISTFKWARVLIDYLNLLCRQAIGYTVDFEATSDRVFGVY